MRDNYKHSHPRFPGVQILRPVTHPRIYLCTDITDYRNHQHLLEPTRGLLLGGNNNILAGYATVFFEKPLRFNVRLDESHHFELSDLHAWTPLSLERIYLTPTKGAGISPEQVAHLLKTQQACLTNVQCIWGARDRRLILNRFTFFEPEQRDRFQGTDFNLPDHWVLP